ncbi:hypothetical protein F4560_004320 [Saccharothrix ecbatanensis]|uniref:Uncharacterized protein n=1 Tax=Saccharothrix ecbatanensis TaxID=1105145 RepID=A0A7W9M248_9PSEU|nr:hypothetical protein [Saccharothrix ecbatanensis]
MRAQLAELARAGDRTALRLLTQLDTGPAESEFAALRRCLSGHTVTVRTVLDRSVGASVRGLAQLDTGVARLTGSVTAHTATVGAATLKYAALAGGIAQVLGLMGGLGAAAGTAAGSLLIVPAIGVAAAVGVRTLKLGVDGLNDALSAETPAEYAKSVKDFPPAMRETTDAVRALRAQLDGLKLDVQARLFAGLGDEVTALGERYLPVLRDGLGGIADGYNHAARQAAGFASEARTVDDVRLILDNTGQAVRAPRRTRHGHRTQDSRVSPGFRWGQERRAAAGRVEGWATGQADGSGPSSHSSATWRAHHGEIGRAPASTAGANSAHGAHSNESTSSGLSVGSPVTRPRKTGHISFSVTPFSITARYRNAGSTRSRVTSFRPSSSNSRRATAVSIGSSGAGWPQHVFVHTPGHVFLCRARLVSSRRPSESNTYDEKARCSGVDEW